jgi:excisionase family DNA binding protein
MVKYDPTHLQAASVLLKIESSNLLQCLEGNFPMPEDRALSINDAAELLGCSRQTIQRMIECGELDSIRLLESRKVLLSSVNAHLKNQDSKKVNDQNLPLVL